MKPFASADVTERNASTIASNKSGTVRFASRRSIVFTLEIACSIGLKSGEYGGSRSTMHPADSIS